MFKIISDDIYYKDVKIATINSKLIASFRGEVEQVILNNFYSENEIEEIRKNAIEDELEKNKRCSTLGYRL